MAALNIRKYLKPQNTEMEVETDMQHKKCGEEISDARGRKRICDVSIVFHVQLIELRNLSFSDLVDHPWANDTAASYMNWTNDACWRWAGQINSEG